jgi:hypothetical protein
MTNNIVALPHPVERSVYHYILDVLENLQFEAISELKSGPDYIDIMFERGKNRFIMEVKIDRRTNEKQISNPIVDGIVQAYRYCVDSNVANLIVLCYPSFVVENISTLGELKEKVLRTKIEAALLTPFWPVHERKLDVEEVLSTLKSKIDQNIQSQLSVQLTSAIIRKCVVTLSRLINKYCKDEKQLRDAMDYLLRDFALPEKLGQHRRKGSLTRYETIGLLAYILVNQILFYFLYSKKSQEMNPSERVDEIKKLNYLTDLDIYFNQIRKINYKPIFDIFVAQRIPSTTEIVREVNNLIECLTPLQVSEMKQDLYGRLIGHSLPLRMRKILASYYTRLQSAELLVNLTIESYADTVWDLACGSGTLLMSSYDRKMKLFKEMKRTIDHTDEDRLHLKFIEQDLTGTDIMPFACHLTGLNLSAKNLKQHTNFTRVSRMNSLSIKSLEEPILIDEAYGDISAELAKVTLTQKTLDGWTASGKVEQGLETNRTQFIAEKVNCVAINPPFTIINKLPRNYRKNITSSASSKICGKRVALWGHFMTLADRVLKDGGKIGAIVPISLLHGKDTLGIRKYYLENYSVQYIIKPAPCTSFSEDVNFTDIILVAKKVKPDRDQKVKLVMLKTDIKEKSSPEIEHLARSISTQLEEEKDESDYWSYEVRQRELVDNIDNLMGFVFTNDVTTKKTFEVFLKKLRNNQNLVTITKTSIHDGNQLRPKGTADLSMFTRYDEANIVRIKHSTLVFKTDDPSSAVLTYLNREENAEKTISKNRLSKTFRTLAGIDVLDISDFHDYILKEKATVKETAHVLMPNKFRVSTGETHLTALYTDEPMCPYNVFTMYLCPKEEAKTLVLYFNSIFYIIQFLLLVKQSTRGFLGISHVDLQRVLIPNEKKVDKTRNDSLFKVFDEIRLVKLPSLLEQLRTRNISRLAIDKAVASYIGIEINDRELKQLYDIAYSQINVNLR